MIKNKITLEWLHAALIRALKTVAQTALGMLTVGAAFETINWWQVLSVALVAGIISILTSVVTTLPEVGSDGTLQIDSSNPAKDVYRLNVDTDLEKVKQQIALRLKVVPNSDLSQEKPML